jgi:hypothetical protein
LESFLSPEVSIDPKPFVNAEWWYGVAVKEIYLACVARSTSDLGKMSGYVFREQ